MHLLKLTAETNWSPECFIEGFNSLIWTERFSSFGDFELKTNMVTETLNLLPLNSVVSIQESKVAMLVENQTIKTDTNGVSELTITGRTLDAILEKRVLRGLYQAKKQVTAGTYEAGVFSAFLLWNELINPSTTNWLFNTARTVDNYITTSNLIATNVGFATLNTWSIPGGPNSSRDLRTWFVEEGALSVQIQAIQKDCNIGLRTLRPPIASTNLIFYQPPVYSTPYLGLNMSTATTLLFEVYNGTDRTLGVSANPVVFSYANGNLESPTYLLSNKEYMNLAYINCKLGSTLVYAETGDENKAGLNRGVLYVDGSNIGTAQGDTYNSILPALQQKAREELAMHNRTFLFDAEVVDTGNYIYGLHYELGDLITLNGEFGLTKTMQISEYIRSQDENGLKEYPTLAQPS